MRSGFAVFLAIVFFLLFPIVLVTITVQTTLLDPAFYKRQLVRNDVYAQWYPIALSSVGTPTGLPGGLRLSNMEMERVLRDVLPPDFVQRQTERAIDDFFAWLDSPGSSLDIRIPLAEVKARTPGALSAAVERQLANLPTCAGQYQLPTSGFPDCLPPGSIADGARTLAGAASARAGEEIARQLPESIGLQDLFDRPGQDGANLATVLEVVKRSVGTFKSASTIIYALAVLLILLIGILTYGPASRAYRWIGVTLLVSGLATLVVLVPAQLVGLPPVGEIVYNGSESASPAFSPLFMSVAGSAMRDFITRLFLVSGTTTGAGLLLIVVGRLV